MIHLLREPARLTKIDFLHKCDALYPSNKKTQEITRNTIWKTGYAEKKCVAHLLHLTFARGLIQEMLQGYEKMIKIVVDIRRRILSGGREMYSDCATVLLSG
jgi:hypothetical protein